MASNRPANTRPAIGCHAISKVFGHGPSAVTALDNVSLDIMDGEFFTLLGPSGCGKTTLLRLIAGFEEANAGQILLFGEEIETLPPHKRPINTVFQQYALFPHMTVAQNVGFGLEMLRVPAAEIAPRVADALQLVKMEDYGARRITALSGGQQQRVALARALAPSPKVLLLDEPLSALDLKLRQAMRGELKSLQRTTGITFVFVTHDQEEALTMSDRIAVMSNGRVQQIGSPREVYEAPVNRFVADFIGDMNFFDAVVENRTDAKTTFRLSNGERIDSTASDAPDKGARTTIAIRPEKIRVAAGGGASAGSVTSNSDGAAVGALIEATIDDISYIGTDTTYHLRAAGDLMIMVREQNARDAKSQFAPGDVVAISVDAGNVRVLRD